jgi:hypothetical protein
MVLAAGLRVWQVRHTEVTTRDSVAFIRYAWRLENDPWAKVVKQENQHPLYPFLVYLASSPVRAVVSDDLPRVMQLTAQLVSCLAGVLLVVPMYFLGCALFSPRVGFWATLLFQCLPASGRVLPDGLTEPVFLLLVASSLLFACRAVRSRGVGWFVLTGLTSGLAYLTRTEGLLVATVTGLVMLALQGSRTWRRPWPAFVRAGLALTVATLIVAAPFMLHIARLSPKPGVKIMMGGQAHLVHTPLPLAAWDYKPGMRAEDRYGWAARALGLVIDKGFFHVLTWPFLAGLFLFRRRPAQAPQMWIPLVLGVVLALLVYRLGQANGYLGERHVLLIVMGGLYWAVAALAVLCERGLPFRVRFPLGSLALPLLLLPVIGLALPKTLAPLHAERAGFRKAGQWLAKHVQPGDVVMDPFTWASYHAGLTFQCGQAGPETSVCYVVLDRSRSIHEHLWYVVGPAEDLANRGVEVRRFPVRVGKNRSTVIVYRMSLAPGEKDHLVRAAGPAVWSCRLPSAAEGRQQQRFLSQSQRQQELEGGR